jgi:hypothetical protein
MDTQGGVESVENLRKAGNGRGKMYIVKNAGHHGKSLRFPAVKLTKELLAPQYTWTIRKL